MKGRKEKEMSFSDKRKKAKPTTWVTDGLTEKQVDRIVKNAKRKARRIKEKEGK